MRLNEKGKQIASQVIAEKARREAGAPGWVAVAGRIRNSMNREMDGQADSELVVVAQFLMEQEFLFARGRLESAGIECFCANEYLSRISSGIYNGMTGGIALQVRREDLDDARAILADPGKPYMVR